MQARRGSSNGASTGVAETRRRILPNTPGHSRGDDPGALSTGFIRQKMVSGSTRSGASEEIGGQSGARNHNHIGQRKSGKVLIVCWTAWFNS